MVSAPFPVPTPRTGHTPRWPAIAAAAAGLAALAFWLSGGGYLLCLRLGTLHDLRSIEVTWRGHVIGHWEDPAKLRAFRASLPQHVEEMGRSRCGDGSVTLLRLRTALRTIDLALPVDQCPAINGGPGRGYSFGAPETLRLISSWIAEDPARLERLGRTYPEAAPPGLDSYPWLRGQLQSWRQPDR